MIRSIRARPRQAFEERRFIHVSYLGCCAGSALAWWVLPPPREQLPHSPAAPLRCDLHHHELRRRQTSGLTNLRPQRKTKAEPLGFGLCRSKFSLLLVSHRLREIDPRNR